MSAKYPEALEDIIDMFKKLPGVGRRSAERMALTMLKWQPDKLGHFGELLKTLPVTVGFCSECGNLAHAGETCQICRSGSRNRSQICVVEDFTQITSIENSAIYKGMYHVLGGKLSPLDNRMADDLNIDSLLKRIENEKVTEIILALSQDIEGQATAIYLANLLKNENLRVTRLARGLPAGSDISYADSATIGAALDGRTEL